MAVTQGGILFQPEPGHIFWCLGCDRLAQPRHVRERVQHDPPDRFLFHTNRGRIGAVECGGRVEQRRTP